MPISIEKWKSKKALTLFKYLSSHPGKRIPKDSIIELLWSDSCPERSTHNLHTTIYNLRRSLFPTAKKGTDQSVICYNNGLYWFNAPDGYHTDLEEFESLAHKSIQLKQSDPKVALDLSLQALRLYRGDFLEEDMYEDWAESIRNNFRERFVDLIIRTAELLVLCEKDYKQAIQICRNALAYDPTREQFHRAIIKYLLMEGRNVDAMQQYKECERILDEEVGLEPSEETNHLISMIRNDTKILPLKNPGQFVLLSFQKSKQIYLDKVLTFLEGLLRQGDLLYKWEEHSVAIYLMSATGVEANSVAKRLQHQIQDKFYGCKLDYRVFDANQPNFQLRTASF